MKPKTKDLASPAAATPAPFIKRTLGRRAPTQDEIAALAKTHWEKAGRPEGRDIAIWLEAERKLRSASDLPSAEDDVEADTRAMLGESSGTFDDRLGSFGDQRGNRSATSL
jgi:hypothetical protein